MPGKKTELVEAKTRKKMVAKKIVPFASPPHHPYEKKIYDAVNGMLSDLLTIVIELNQQPNDGNLAPTNGMIGRLEALLQELKYGSTDQATHDSNIEAILYAIAQICDQFNIGGHSPPTQAYPQPSPTAGTHQYRVLLLFTKIDSICRDIFHILEPGTTLTAQPTGSVGNTHNIVAMAKDTQMVVKQISIHIVALHGTTAFSK
jgi:hypothetical protein